MIRLRISGGTRGGWRVAVGRPGGCLREIGVDPGEIAEALDPGDPARSAPGLVVPGRDAAACRAEQTFGAALSRAIGAEGRGRLSALCHEAWAGEQRPVVVLDLAEPEVDSLAWELLADDPVGAALESSGRAVVARLHQGPDRPWRPMKPGSALRILVWAPDPADTAVREVLRHIDEHALSAGLGPPERITPDRPLSPAGPEVVSLLHVVVHGQSELDELLLLSRGQQVGIGSATHGLRGVIEGAPLAVLSVCEGGRTQPEVLHSLAGRLLDAGCRTVLAPAKVLDAQAAGLIARRVQAALIAGGSVAEAVASARAALAQRAIPAPSWRWWNPRWTVRNSHEAEARPVVAPWWRAAAWPEPGEEARAALVAAGGLAVRGGLGFVGLEHLTLATLSLGPAIALDAGTLEILVAHSGLVERRLERLATNPEWAGGLAPTPRILALGPTLQPGFTVADLWRSVACDPWNDLGLPPPADLLGFSASRSHTQHEVIEGPLRGPLHAQVVGGPEDGRLVTLRAGETLGRWSVTGPFADHALYQRTGATDGWLRRLHLRVVREGVVHLSRSGSLLRRGEESAFTSGDVLVERADLVRLTHASALRLGLPASARAQG